MTLDPYTPCPGGTGKKVKFCCTDMLGELEKVLRMYEGEQRLACLEYIEKLEPKFADRACLLSIKGALLAELRRVDEYRDTMANFVRLHPQNAIALADSALTIFQSDGPAAAVDRMQQALEVVAESMPAEVYHALGAMAQLLVASGYPAAALAHGFLQVSCNPRDEQAADLLMRLMASSAVPLLLKDELHLAPAPASANWKAPFNAALEEAQRGRWRRAAQQFAELNKKAPGSPEILQNLARVRTWLADNAGAVAAWREYAALDIPLDLAVEAEATAQLLDRDEPKSLIDVVSITYPVLDIERLQTALTASSRAAEVPVGRQRRQPDEPPPRAVFVLLDRALSRGEEAVARERIPRTLGTIELFGRETDRAARLDLVAYRNDALVQAQALLAELATDSIGPPGPDETVAHVPALSLALATNWHLPPDLPPERMLALAAEERREKLFERWPTMAMPLLDGRTPLEATADPRLRIKVAALVLLLELAGQREGSADDFNALRTRLGLTTSDPIDPTTVDVNQLSLARLGRLDFKKLTDEQLVQSYLRAASAEAPLALRHAALEIVVRPSLNDKVDLDQIFGQLAATSSDINEAAGFFDQARAVAESKGQSTARWDLEELNMRLAHYDEQEAGRLMQHLAREHINEPGVREALGQILMAAGVIGPDGRPTASAAAPAASIIGGAAPAAEPGKIWTPDSDRPSGGAKSAIWTPGSD